MTFRFSFNAFYFTRPIPFTDSLISANRKRALKSVDKYIRCMDSQARYARLLGGENVGERGGRGDNLRRSEDTVGNRVFSQRLFPSARENKREKWGGAARKRSACGITMPWFIDSSRPTDDALSVYPAVHGICGLAISWFAFYGLIGIRSRTKHAQKSPSPFQLRLCFYSKFVRRKASFDFCPIILRFIINLKKRDFRL